MNVRLALAATALAGVPGLAGCAPGSTAPKFNLALDAAHPTAVIATASAIADVSCEAGWTATVGAESFSGVAQTVIGADGIQTATILGLPVNAAVSVVAESGAEEVAPSSATAITTTTPDGVPHLDPLFDPLLDSPALDEGYILTSAIALPDGAAMSMSTVSGDLVWWEPIPTNQIVSHAHYDAVNHLVYAVETALNGTDTEFVRAGMSGPTERWPAPFAHHDSLDLGDGKYLLTVSDERPIDGDTIEGDDLVVLDTSDGSLTSVWSAFDHLTVRENEGWNVRSPDGAADWTHFNGLNRDPDTGLIYVSLYYEHAILEIDPTTWTMDWILGGNDSNFAVSPSFGPQHSPIRVGGSLYMFDNDSDVAAGSRLAEYTIDATAMTATQSWSWQPETAPYNVVLGSIDLADDAKLASWGDTGEVRILDTNDTVVGYYDLEDELQIGYTSFVAGF